MALTATGIGSGLDIEGLVRQLMAAERLPLETRWVQRETSITQDISALGSLKGALAGFRSSLAAANSLATFDQRIATSSKPKSVSISASNKAALGSYDVSVESLASTQSLAVRNQFSSVNEVVGTGTLTFTFGTTSYTADSGDPINTANDTYDGFVAKAGAASHTITIDSTNNTLSGVRDAINSADIGISAAVVNDGAGYRLLISSVTKGAENSVEIVVSDTGDGANTDQAGLSRLAFNTSAGTASVYQTAAASDAQFTVNGLALSSTSNVVSDAINGLTLTLGETATAVSLEVKDNASGIKRALNDFVGGYNDLIDTLNALTAYDPATGQRGALQGDFSARSIVNQLRATIGAEADGFKGALTRLPEIGVTTSATGTLVVDDAELDAALKDDIDTVAGVLSHFANPSASSGMTVSALATTTLKGEYSVAVSSLATHGRIAATVPAVGFPVTVDNATNDFVITVDGTSSGTITLASQAYASLSAIATEIQTKINADSVLRAAGKAVTVSVSGDDIEIRSNTAGSSSAVALVNANSDTTLTALGLAAATTTNGTDLIGTIDGASGTAVGNTLTAALGSSAAGLSLDIASTAGGRVTVSYGVIDQLDSWLAGLLGDDNSLDSRISSLESQVDEIAKERVAAERRLEATEKRYRTQFNALDSLLSELNSTGSFISDQLANIPVPGKTRK